jgi:hypothetical protein
MTRSQADARSVRGTPDLPDGTLIRSRVESDPAAPLATALDRDLTGYAVFEPQDALLLDADGAGVVGFEDGVPQFAFHTGTGRGGPAALADIAGPGPYDVQLRDVSADALAAGHRQRLGIPPGMAADRLAGDPDLAERTRTAAPAEWEADAESGGEDGSLDAVEAFLDDEEKIAAIRDRAREEARERAEQWGLDRELE